MVASRLNSSTAAHLVPFANFGCDLDGSLLVDEPSQKFTGGFEWGSQESKYFGFVTLSNLDGIGVLPK